jgi:hypothetical protein
MPGSPTSRCCPAVVRLPHNQTFPTKNPVAALRSVDASVDRHHDFETPSRRSSSAG